MKRWNSDHRRSILFLFVVTAAVGGLLALKLPVSLFPTIDFPRVMVSLEAGDQPIEQMVLQVTTPVEAAVRRVPGVHSVRSTTSRGAADISINFDWGIDMETAALQINAAISPLLPALPKDTVLDVRRMDTTVFPIIAYSLTSKTTSLTQLHDIAQYQLLPLLTGVDGVAHVQVMDSSKEEYRVNVDTDKLRAFNLAFDDVTKALSTVNTISASGKIEEHYKLYLVVADTRLHDADSLLNTVIKKTGSGVVRVKDVATVTLEPMPEWVKVNADGKDAVLINIFQQLGSNSVKIEKAVKEALNIYQTQLPPDVKLANWYDQSVLVVDSAASVRDAILIGIALAGIVLWLFLRNLRITLIAIVMVPTVLAITVIVLSAFNMSFNIMTLGGMAAAVGLLIDDTIVMLEHIVRRLQERRKQNLPNGILQAADEFFKPLIGSSGATLVIFIPLAFLSGVTGAFFKALSLTMASALVISFLITWLAVPLLSDMLIGASRLHTPHGEARKRLTRRYHLCMRRLLKQPSLLLLGVAPLIAVGVLAYTQVGSGFMPSIDEGGFVLDYRAAPGTALTESDRLLRQVEKIIAATPEVETYSRRTGAGLGGSINEANEGDFFVRLKPLPRRALSDIMDELRGKIEHDVPGLETEFVLLMEDFIGDLTAVPQPVEIKIYSDNPDTIVKLAQKVTAAIAHVQGLVDLKDGINPAGDALEVHIDPTKAALEGEDVTTISQSLQNYTSGVVATQIIRPSKLENVRVWVPHEMRARQADLEKLSIRAADGHIFPLSRVAEFTAVIGQPQVTRENLKRMVAVTARIAKRDTGSVMADIKKIIDQKDMLPKGVYYELGGLYKEQQTAFHDLTIVFGSAVALVFLLLLFLYERFSVALAIMAMPVLAIGAVFIGLWITGVELNISAMMGMTMIVGIITEVSIFYFSEYFSLLEEHGHAKALIEAAINRARPIIMTTLTAILTLLPLAFALGQGAAMQQPLAIVIVSGLIVQLPLVLIVMPVLFQMMQRQKNQIH